MHKSRTNVENCDGQLAFLKEQNNTLQLTSDRGWMSFKASEVTAETNCPKRHMGSSITLLDLTVSSCQERLDKSCWTSIATSNQNSADESLASIAHVPDKEVKGVLELKRMVEAWPLGVA